MTACSTRGCLWLAQHSLTALSSLEQPILPTDQCIDMLLQVASHELRVVSVALAVAAAMDEVGLSEATAWIWRKQVALFAEGLAQITADANLLKTRKPQVSPVLVPALTQSNAACWATSRALLTTIETLSIDASQRLLPLNSSA